MAQALRKPDEHSRTAPRPEMIAFVRALARAAEARDYGNALRRAA